MNFDEDEINLIVKALRYTTEYGYECTQCQEEVDEYEDMRALIQRLDPKPVKKEGWILKDQLISIWNSVPTEDLEMFQRITWEEE